MEPPKSGAVEHCHCWCEDIRVAVRYRRRDDGRRNSIKLELTRWRVLEYHKLPVTEHL
jgi:hypothetical protein